jgi:translation initiation factor 1A
MPNKKGGKGYKKGKGGADKKEEFIDIQPGQYIARITRVLGGRNVLCFCQDNIVRVCHLMKGRPWVGLGDIVLISLRDFSADDAKKIKRGDILAKYPPEQVRQLSKDTSINARLFLKLEEDSKINMETVGLDLSGTVIVQSEDGFDFASGSESESDDEEEVQRTAKKDKVSHGRGTREVREGPDIAAGDKDVDIDEL